MGDGFAGSDPSTSTFCTRSRSETGQRPPVDEAAETGVDTEFAHLAFVNRLLDTIANMIQGTTTLEFCYSAPFY
jgi:hypothetical protein